MTEKSSGNMVGEVPMVSVIVPTRNRPQFLKEALQSISAQTYGSFEIIVVNDAGEDVSEIINSFKDERIKYIRHDANKGLAASRNTGVEAARGKYIAYLDDDDIYYPDHLETLAGFLENSGCAVAYSDSYQAFQVRDNGRYITKEKRLVYSEDFDRQRLLVMNYIPFINIVHRRECIEQAGFFDEALKSHEDWDCLIRLSQSYDFHHVKKVTAEFRTRHTLTDSLSSDRSEMLKTMKLIHSRYSPLASGPNIIRQQKYVEDELAKEIGLKNRHTLGPGSFTLETSKTGKPSLRVKGDDGSVKTLHSLYDPEGEARSLVEAFQFDGKGVLVVLGLGLGYHVKELAKKYPEALLIVVEAMPEILELAKESGVPLWERGGKGDFQKNVEFIVGHSSDEVLRKITSCQMKDGIKPLSVFTLSSAVSAFPSYYQPLLSALKKTVSVKLWDRLRYPKFREDALRVVLIDSGYFLVKEVEKALIALNHKVMKISVRRGGGSEAVISGLIESILQFRPDFILTLNHLGFDEEGMLTSFFKSIEMPVASWYVDSPNLIVRAFDKNVSPYVSLLLWDRTYIDDMKRMGFESVNYLPLATDENIFKPMKRQGQEVRGKGQGYECDVGFVGNSMVEPVSEWMLKVHKEYHPHVETLAEELACGNALLNPAESPAVELDEKSRMDFEAAVIWRATLLYRLLCIKMLEGHNVRIYGDKGWRKLLEGKKIRLFNSLNYYKELPVFYNACKINFNATSLQMREAVNQRVFDIPACGAFILTDYQRSLDELFDVGKEIIVYRDKDEIPGLVKYYLDNPDQREAVAEKGLERVLKEHTYKHRLEVMIHAMKGRYA